MKDQCERENEKQKTMNVAAAAPHPCHDVVVEAVDKVQKPESEDLKSVNSGLARHCFHVTINLWLKEVLMDSLMS